MRGGAARIGRWMAVQIAPHHTRRARRYRSPDVYSAYPGSSARNVACSSALLHTKRTPNGESSQARGFAALRTIVPKHPSADAMREKSRK